MAALHLNALISHVQRIHTFRPMVPDCQVCFGLGAVCPRPNGLPRGYFGKMKLAYRCCRCHWIGVNKRQGTAGDGDGPEGEAPMLKSVGAFLIL